MDKKDINENEYFMQLFLKSQRRIYGYVMTLIPNPSDADDIVQEVASVLWAKFDEFQPGTDFTAWALTIARYKVYNYLRTQQSNRKKFGNNTLQKIQQFEAQNTQSETDRVEILRRCIEKLKEKEREILAIRYEEGMTLNKLAGRLGLNVNTLYSRLSKIHLMLLNCMKKSMIG